MIHQPCIDAIGVEHVAAFGDQAQRFVVAELVETNSAFQRGPPDLQGFNLGVHERRKRVHYRPVEPVMLPPVHPAGDRHSQVEPPSDPPLSALARVDGHESQRKEDHYEDHQNRSHGLVESQSRERIQLWR